MARLSYLGLKVTPNLARAPGYKGHWLGFLPGCVRGLAFLSLASSSRSQTRSIINGWDMPAGSPHFKPSKQNNEPLF